MPTIYVKPRPGLSIIDPERRTRLPGDRWRPVPLSTYWTRLNARGDVLIRREMPDGAEIEGSGVEAEPEPEPSPPARRRRKTKPEEHAA